MEGTGEDVLGDVFAGGITYGEGGQFFTPESITRLMAELMAGEDEDPQPKSICDPACGSGRFLLAIGKKHPHWELVGQDVDHRCTQMTAINLGLRGLFGWAVWQNSLSLEIYRVYKIGLNLQGGVIREVPVDRSPFDYTRQQEKPPTKPTIRDEATRPPRTNQLDLF